MTYQATPPEIGINILFETYLNAKNQAEKLFKTLDKEKFTEKSKTLWFVLSEKSVDYKIKEMIKSARESIFMAAPPEYLKYFKKFDGTDLKIDFIIFSDDKKTRKEIKVIFRKQRG